MNILQFIGWAALTSQIRIIRSSAFKGQYSTGSVGVHFAVNKGYVKKYFLSHDRVTIKIKQQLMVIYHTTLKYGESFK